MVTAQLKWLRNWKIAIKKKNKKKTGLLIDHFVYILIWTRLERDLFLLCNFSIHWYFQANL